MTEAIILAGGRGTRLRSTVPDLPKPLAPIAGAPFLMYLLKHLERCGISRFVLSVGYRSEAIIRSLGDDFNGIPIAYVFERTPLGTGGAIGRALSECAENSVFVLNGDSYFGIDPNELARLHARQDADISVALKEMSDFERYGAIELEGERIRTFREKARTARGYINGGVYCVRRDVFAGFDLPKRFSFEAFLAQNTDRLKLCGLPLNADFIDIGIPEDYDAAQSLLPRWVRL
jgi:D-glycero-alpha-D-manno-heptose 1-phosphate guanylyltransferase